MGVCGNVCCVAAVVKNSGFCFSCSTSTSSLPAALLFFSAATPFLYSSSLKGCAIVGIPSWIGGSIGRFGFVGIVPWPLMSNLCATWLAFTSHGRFRVVGSLDSFLIVCHALRLLCVVCETRNVI